MANVNLEVDARTARAVQELDRVVRAQENIKNKTNQAGQSFKNSGQETLNFVKNVATATAGLLGLSVGLNQVIDLAKAYDQHLNEVGRKQEELGRAAVPFAALQPEGQVEANVAKATALIGQAGVKDVNEGYLTFQRAQSLTGSFEAAVPEAVAAMRLGVLTGDQESARGALKTAQALGISTEEFGSLLVGGSATSAADEAAFLRAAPSLPLFAQGGVADPYFGIATLNALTTSGMVADEELNTYAKAAAMALTKENKLTKRIRGYEDMDLRTRLAAIRDYTMEKEGAVDFESLQAAGITEQRQAIAMAAMLKEGIYEPQFLGTLEAAPGYAEEYSVEGRLGAIQESPIVRGALLAEAGEGKAAAYRAVGPEAERGRATRAKRIELGAEGGYGMGIDEQGMAGKWRRVLDAMFTPAPGYIGPEQAFISQEMRDRMAADRGKSPQDQAQDALDRIDHKLGEIAGLTREQTDVLKDSATGPGLPDTGE